MLCVLAAAGTRDNNEQRAWHEQHVRDQAIERTWNERRALARKCDRAIVKLCAYIFVLVAVEISLWVIGDRYEKQKKTDATTVCFVAMPAAMALFFYLANKMLVNELSFRRSHYLPLV